ncbi:MAG: SCO family protein [Anaerolineales bacterium]
MKYVWLFGIAALIGLALGYSGIQFLPQPYRFQGSAIEPPVPAADFTLQTHDGQPFTLSAQRGKVVLLFFGYTSCPDVCPATWGAFKKIAAQLGERAAEAQFVMITADPERDTPDQMANYITAFNPNFLGLTGSQEALQPVYEAYGAFVEKEETDGATGYLIAHTSRVYVIDQEGRLRLTFPFGMAAEAMAADVYHLLEMKGSDSPRKESPMTTAGE